MADFNACRAPQQEPYRLLAEAGFEVMLALPQAWQEAHGLAKAELPKPHARLRAALLPLVFNGKYHRVLFAGLSRLVKEFQPDHLWVHAEPENFLALQALRARDRHCPRAALTLVSWRNIDYGRNRLPYRLAGLHQRIEDRLRRSGARLLCYNRDALRIMGGLGFEVASTRMGVSLAHFSPGSKAAARRKLGLKARGRVAGFAGRFLPEKGVSDLIQAAARLKGWSLLLIGDGPARRAWLEQAAAAGVAVEWRVLKHEDMAVGLRAMDLLALPSRSTPAWKEQFGRVLIEAMACGTPVAGSDSGAIPEVIGTSGAVFPEGDVAALARALAARKARGLAARARHFSWDSIARELRAIFPPLSNRLNSVPVQGVGVFGGGKWEALGVVEMMLRSRQAACVFYLNAHTANLAASDLGFRAELNSAELVLPDGGGVLLAARLMGRPLKERLALGDLVQPMAGRAALLGRPVFLWGGEKGVAEAAASVLPGKIAGCSHGFQDAAGEEAVIARIRASRAGLVFVGMGSPRQERLCLRLRREIPGIKAVACGNAFTFIAGLQRRAPLWMQRSHMEWLWRLGLEPRRLWRRYLLGNLRFLWRSLWERLTA